MDVLLEWVESVSSEVISEKLMMVKAQVAFFSLPFGGGFKKPLCDRG